MWRKVRAPWIISGVIIVSFAIDISVFRILYARLSKPLVEEIVIGTGAQEPGILMATDEDGLRVMSSKPPFQVTVIDEIGTMVLGGIHIPPQAPRTAQPKKGQMLVLNGTKASFIIGKFLLKDGRLVDPYPSCRYQMEKDGVIEVDRVRITDGPQRNLEGWVRSDDLQRTYTPSL